MTRKGLGPTPGSFKKGAPAWNKGKHKARIKGYRYITINGKQLKEHRHVMENHLGRKLTADEVIHHKNGNILDNRIENLEIISSQSEHMSSHMTKARAMSMAAKTNWMKAVNRRLDRIEAALKLTDATKEER